MQSSGRTVIWDTNFGKRFLGLDSFIEFCQVVGLYNVSRLELEEYERSQYMFPVARLVMPESYAQAFWNNLLTGAEFQFDDVYRPHHELEMTLRYRYPPSHINPGETDLRHPIDKSQGKLEGLRIPKDKTHQSWDSYNISIADNPFSTVTHFYHYWQVYEIYQVRRERKKMYQDDTQQFPESLEYGNIWALAPFFDALSYFQHLYRSRYRQIVDPILPDADGVVVFDAQQQQAIEQSAHDYVSQTLAIYRLSESDYYNALRGMLFLHLSYEQSERNKLADTLKSDIWRMVELIGFAFSVSPEDISDRIGYVGIGTSNQKTLEALFPNRRKVVREKARKILVSISTAYNKVTQNYRFLSQDSDELLNFVEGSDLAVFEYALVELNETHFNRTSWYVAESFLRLKSLASFPESLIRTLIHSSSDTLAQHQLSSKTTATLYDLLTITIQPIQPSVWRKYEASPTLSLRSANSTVQFQTNLNSVIPLVVNSTTEDEFLGRTLVLATLLRNFTSHHLVENPAILSGQNIHCVHAILSTTFFVWRIAKSRGWA